jgi:hypothetical protein
MVRFDFREVRATQAGSGSSAITALQQAAIYKLILEITFAADATWLSAKRNDRALQIRRHGSRLLAHSIRVPFFPSVLRSRYSRRETPKGGQILLVSPLL